MDELFSQKERLSRMIRLSDLTWQEEGILILRYGLGPFGQLTLKETGKKVGYARDRSKTLSAERTRQVEARAKKRVREKCNEAPELFLALSRSVQIRKKKQS